MNRSLAENVLMVVCLCLWWPQPLEGQEDSAKRSQLSIGELETKTLSELRQEQARLTRLLSDMDPFKNRPESWQLTMDQLAKARLMGEIVRMQYLARALEVREERAPEHEAGPIKFELRSDPARITVLQRRSKPIPGFHGVIKVRIGDITHGQVLVEIISEDILRPVVDTISARQGDVIPFVLGGTEYYVSVIELRNLLVGDDFGVFEITTKCPDQVSEIERLLKAIQSSGLVFLRNGKEATASVTANRLRSKWRKATPPIRTVQDFIDRVASRSSATGRPYEVELADGSTIEAKDWLRRQLNEADRQFDR